MKRPSPPPDFLIESLTGLKREQCALIADQVIVHDFYDKLDAETFRWFLITGLEEAIEFARGCAEANSEIIEAGAADALPANHEIFESEFVLADIIETLRGMYREQIVFLFGYLLGLYFGYDLEEA